MRSRTGDITVGQPRKLGPGSGRTPPRWFNYRRPASLYYTGYIVGQVCKEFAKYLLATLIFLTQFHELLGRTLCLNRSLTHVPIFMKSCTAFPVSNTA